MASLAERLGYGPDAKLLILTCDDLGQSHAANAGVFDALRSGLGTSASLMVPAPWARAAAAEYRGDDVGVHLTLNSELERYRWGPITQAPSLLDGDGGFPRTVDDLWDHADLDEVRRECRAQIERAILWGFDVSHLDTHLGALQMRPEFFDVYLELAVEFRLPLRLTGAHTEALAGFPFRALAADEGVVFPDDLLTAPGMGARKILLDALDHLGPGVTEIYLHPALETAELLALAPDWEARVDDHRLLVHDTHVRDALRDAGVILIGYRPLRDLMRDQAVTTA
ncbi:MAG TPA: polysaccharide deacetylase family protein [Acidimicrobiales bacterium]|nr:polysaccharide deacetylase family protein [Acidimicrobiales bacterium]